MPVWPSGFPGDLASDRAALSISSATTWGMQPITAEYPFRAGIWPRLDGNRYSNQPDVGLAATRAARARQGDRQGDS